MALQTSNLIMVGLGSANDVPPNAEQPPLVDAIHLRWAFKRELGFPWFGFYLFRRQHNAGTLTWLSQFTGKLPKGEWSDSSITTPMGRVVSDKKLVLTEDFLPSDLVEFDLSSPRFLGVVFPEAEPVRRIQAKVGFRQRPGDPPPTMSTITFRKHNPGAGPNPLDEKGVKFESLDKADGLRPNTSIRSVQTPSGTVTGLGCKFKLRITLPQPATFVEVTLTGAGRRNAPDGTPTIEAFNQDKTRADFAYMRDPGSREEETFLLVGTAITQIVIDEHLSEPAPTDDQERVILNEISYGNGTISDVRLTAYAGTTPVRSTTVRGYAGRIVTTDLEFEGINVLEITSAHASLIDLGTVPLSQGSTTGWTSLSQFPYPLRLPLTHPDYPCTPQMNEDYASSRQLATSRILYGSAAQFVSAPTPITNAGTISVTKGSPIVVGTNTNWTSALLDTVLQVSGDPTVYTVVMVVSPTKLVLSRNYSGNTRSGAAYSISRDKFGQLYNYLVNLVTGGSAAGPMTDRTLPAPVTKSGTVSLEEKSATVTGSGTTWTEGLEGLDFQLKDDDAVYTITKVDSPTRLTLDRPYPFASSSGKNYLTSARLQSSVSGSIVPRMPAQSPLDIMLLGTLHPAVAQMSGLYWADRTADPELIYDYLVVADYNGVGQLNPEEMLNVLGQSGFSNVQGSIVYNVRLTQAAPLEKPSALEVYALPGSSRKTESGNAEESVNNVGLRWNLDKTNFGVLLPGRPVMYHLWRANLGNNATPNAPTRYDLITKNWPVLVVDNGNTLRPAPDWPEFPLHALDNALGDGWWGYQVSGIDIFGRHTPNSVAGAWKQWAPVPEPRPWYYLDPPSDAVIHASAVRLLTKTAPPSPTAIEAYALDPRDLTVVKDSGYNEWWTNLNKAEWYKALSDSQKLNLIGFRVRWQWPQTHIDQAPHTREFRIYYQPGTLNARLGKTKTVVDEGTESIVTTDIPNTEEAGSYIGCALHAGQDAFAIVGSEAGSPMRLRVRNVGPKNNITPPPNTPCTVAMPAVYSEGLVSVANGSRVVTGDGTNWNSSLEDMMFQVATDERAYRIESVTSQSHLVLAEPYTAATKGDRVYGIRHPRFVDYTAPTNWQKRYYVVNFDQHWTPTTDKSGQPVRQYDIILPVPEESVHEGVPLVPSRTEPIVYSHAGVTAADDKSYTSDDPKWTAPWAGRIGNEGRVGPAAKIFRVLRDEPPAPVLPRMPERLTATRADHNGASFYTFRWQLLHEVQTHVFRAFDDSVFRLDWSKRPFQPLDPAKLEFFPSEAIDPRWTGAKRQQVATELNKLNTFAHDDPGTAQALAYYRGLSADAQRVLAGLPHNHPAFTQITTAPLDLDDPKNLNRRGPDDPDNFQVGDPTNPLASPTLRAFVDTLDGLVSNRYFYRAAHIDAAHNPSKLSLATPPVKCPRVVRPQTPVITKAEAGSLDREIKLTWATTQEPDLLEYRIFRAESADDASDTRSMVQVAVVGVASNPADRPMSLTWTDHSIQGLKDYWYRIVAAPRVDPLEPQSGANISEPSPAVKARAKQGPPAPPVVQPPVWDGSHTTVTLNWQTPDPHSIMRVERRVYEGAPWQAATGWLPPGTHGFTETPPQQTEEGWDYRIRVQDALGQQSFSAVVRTA